MHKLLVNAIQAAAMLDIGERTFHNLRLRADFTTMCPAIRLSARAVKWRVADLDAWARSIASNERAPQPEQLVRARARRQANAER
jgi:predicted DNA-binding transcriptional regulator AlpA